MEQAESWLDDTEPYPGPHEHDSPWVISSGTVVSLDPQGKVVPYDGSRPAYGVIAIFDPNNPSVVSVKPYQASTPDLQVAFAVGDS